jgi:hypothetical protein
MVGATVGVSGREVIVAVGETDVSVGGKIVSVAGSGWQAAKNRKTTNKILFKCRFYPLIDSGKLSGKVMCPPSALYTRFAWSPDRDADDRSDTGQGGNYILLHDYSM